MMRVHVWLDGVRRWVMLTVGLSPKSELRWGGLGCFRAQTFLADGTPRVRTYLVRLGSHLYSS